MRKLIASTFVSLDGVMQAPGGPEEDSSGGFGLGGWMFRYEVDGADIAAAGFDGQGRELLLGRRTYQIFEGFWPYQPDDDPIAKTFNATRKYVASRSLTTLGWNNAVLLAGDVTATVATLKTQPGPDLQIIGSGELIQTLQVAGLIDEYNVWCFPLLLGHGKRLFGDAIQPVALKLLRSRQSDSGVVMSTYAPAGRIQPGSFATREPSPVELARRGRMASGAW
ncbi:MAG TPA: dihydrofolate reductase family protein [Rhodanobacteraceae bacterium]|nr:dihydrofolate reductase family protein [Rhodanobacteraceae bacterium]